MVSVNVTKHIIQEQTEVMHFKLRNIWKQAQISQRGMNYRDTDAGIIRSNSAIKLR